MTTRELTIFCAVCRNKSISRAAEELGINPSSVSVAMSKIEAKLHTKLLVRTNHGTQLTEKGKQFWLKAGNILLALENLDHFATGEEHLFPLHIGIDMHAGEVLLPEIGKEIRSNFPDAIVTVDKHEKILYAWKTHELDMAIFSQDYPNTENGASEIFREKLSIVANSELSIPEAISIRDVFQYPILLWQAGERFQARFETECAVYNVSPHILMKSVSVHCVLEALREIKGVSFLPESAIRRNLKNYSLKEISAKGVQPELYYYLVCNEESIPTAQAAEFTELLHSKLLSMNCQSA